MQFGDFEIHLVSDGMFRLDGGAMFGVIPKVLWQKTDPPNEMNRILLGLNCMLIKTRDDVILVDTGIGENYSDKFKTMFEIDHSAGNLLQGLAGLGITPPQVTKVVLTHLHFDHSGRNCTEDDAGNLVPTFPNAIYYFQQGEFEYAQNPDARSRGSYLPQNWDAVVAAGQLELLSGAAEIVPGVEVEIASGHTKYHQIVKVKSQGKTAAFLADLVPTSSHLKTPYVMGYDLYPKTTMEVKERILGLALAEKWLLLFEHAPRVRAGYLQEEDGKIQLKKVDI